MINDIIVTRLTVGKWWNLDVNPVPSDGCMVSVIRWSPTPYCPQDFKTVGAASPQTLTLDSTCLPGKGCFVLFAALCPVPTTLHGSRVISEGRKEWWTEWMWRTQQSPGGGRVWLWFRNCSLGLLWADHSKKKPIQDKAAWDAPPSDTNKLLASHHL